MMGGYPPGPGAPPQGAYPPPGNYGAPPGGYGPPGPPGYGAGPGGSVGQLASFTHQEAYMPIVLTMVTCGIYFFIWKYRTTDELRIASGDESIKPGMDLLLTFLTCGLWGIYTDYRNAKKCYELSQRFGLNRSDQSTIVIVTMLLGVGFAGWYMLQQEFNALGAAGRGQPVR